MKSFLLTVVAPVICVFLIPLTSNAAQWVQGSGTSGTIYSLTGDATNLVAGRGNVGSQSDTYVSAVGSGTWSATGGTGIATDYVNGLTTGTSYLLAATNFYIYKSTDHASTWAQTSATTQTYNCVAASGTNALAGTSGKGWYYTTDSGTNWTQVTSSGGLDTLNVPYAVAINGSDMYVASDSGMYYSTDGGSSWLQPSGTTLNGVTITSIVVNTSNGYVFVGSYTGIYRSTNSGANWSEVDTGVPTGQYTVLTFSGTNLVAGVYQNGVYVSPDEGLTWVDNTFDLGSGNTNIHCIFVNSDGVYVGTDNGVYSLPISDVSLDVQATSFKASAVWNGIQLSWIAQSQVDNAGFNILRKDPGSTSYELIASYTSNDSLKGLGTTTSPTTYTFTDTKVQSGQTYTYMVQSVSTTGRTAEVNTISATAKIPQSYALYQNFPNPFNPSTTIIFDLKQASHVTLDIYNVLGQKVLQQNYGNMQAGSYQRTINMDRFASGVYFYMLKAAGQNSQPFQSVKKMILLK